MKHSERGQIIIMALIFMSILIFLSGGLIGFVGQNIFATRAAVAKEQALQLADAAVDKALWQLNETAGAYGGELATALGTGEFDVGIVDILEVAGRKEITATGYVPSKATPRATREVKVVVSIETASVSFNFGVQVGDGGLLMKGNSYVTGNVYSNGPIRGLLSGAFITGDAFSAGPLGEISNLLRIDGDAYAHTIDAGVLVGGGAYGQILDDVTVGGSVFMNSISNCTIDGNASYTTKSACGIGGSETAPYPGEPDPEPQDFPISDSQITDWKTQAEAGGVIVGNYTVSTATDTLGPKKVTGNLIILSDAKLTMTGPIWVGGSVIVNDRGILALDSSYGNISEVLVTDGIINLSKNAEFQRAGPDSFILVVTASSSPAAAIVGKGVDAGVIYAPNGTVVIQNHAVLREVSGWKIILEKDAGVIYETGLANIIFTSGPGGSWEVVRGTWREIR